MTATVEALMWTQPEAAARINVSPRMLRNLTRSGDDPSVHIGAKLLYREADLRAYVESLEPTNAGRPPQAGPPRSPAAKPG